ncbi:phospholipase A2 inhibitor and Ly6/PLAUR domain-containing protein-like [Rhineura floridana]|uniref:phospholipase A2 inhibitor and Ly6/PLAUR domain-containing protein-like n=1 Tax=Rhineura floridana TaxID=261503 RepID=UPI002AC81AEF|nr:phospholipase A2 inhibitor and Ly6/PLAUR domain-containing protein-like [Rhineura floridana]
MQMSLIFYLFFLLLATGVCLYCERCSSSSDLCTGTSHLCPGSEDTCLIFTTENTVGNDRWLSTYKGCTKREYCPPTAMTFTFPNQRKRRAAKCCHRDLCNSGAVSLPRLGTRPNGFKCPGCFSESPKCPTIEILNCHGWERKCVSYDVTVEQGEEIYTFTKRGCGTKRSCVNEPLILGLPGSYIEMWKKATCAPAQKDLH